VSSASYLLFKKNGGQIASLEANPVTDVTVDDYRLAVDDIDREPLTHFSCVHIGQHDVEHERLAGQSGFAAERNPLVAAALLNHHVGEYPQRTISGFVQSVSSIASSVRHVAGFSNGDAAPHMNWKFLGFWCVDGSGNDSTAT
jgi:hypothetical protein